MLKHRFDKVSEELEVADAAIAGVVEGIGTHLDTTVGHINHLSISILRALKVTLAEIQRPLSELDLSIREHAKNKQARL